MSRRSRRNKQPDVQRARGLSLPPGTVAVNLANTAPANPQIPQASQQFNNQYGAFNVQGTNSIPASAYTDPRTIGPLNTMFPPGDPIRPVPGLDNGQGGPRQWSFPIGVNIATQPRQTESTPFETLRNLSALYEAIGLCEMAIFRILDRLTLQVTPRNEYLSDAEDATSSKWLDPGLRMAAWFEEGPDKQSSNSDLHGWMKAVMRDILELDAVGIWHFPTKDGSLKALQYVAGDTLVCLDDVAGRTPMPPMPAYRQTLYGAPGVLMTADELDYLRITERTDSLYGISPVERIIMVINQALRKQNYDLTRYTNGATPEGVIETSQPELFKMTQDEVSAWEQMWNAALAGNDAMRARTKFVPPGFHFTSTEQRDIATQFDEFLLSITVSAFGLTKDELGFTDTSNRSTGQTQESVTYRNAVRPRTDFFAKYFTNKVIRRYDGKPLYARNPFVSRPGSASKGKGAWDARYFVSWRGIEEPEDFVRNANAYSILVKSGIVGPTQAKRQLGIPLEPGEEVIPPFMVAPGGTQGIVFLPDMLDQRDQMKSAQVASLQAQEASAKQTKKAMDAGINGPGMAGNMAQVAQQQVAHNMSAVGQGQQAIAPKAANPGTQAAAKVKTGAGGANNAVGASGQPRGASRADGGADGAGWESVGGSQRDALGTPGGDAPGYPGITERDAGGDGSLSNPPLGGGVYGAGDESDALPREDVQGDAITAGESLHRVGSLRPDGGRFAAGERDSATLRGGAGISSAGDARDSADIDDRRHRGAPAGATGSPGEGAGSQGRTEGSRESGTGSLSDEWATWRERALRDVKSRGRVTRPFVPHQIDGAMHGWVTTELAHCHDADDVRAVFQAAREREHGTVDVATVPIPLLAAPAEPLPAADDPVNRMLNTLLARFEQVAAERATQQATTLATSELREIRARVLDGLTP